MIIIYAFGTTNVRMIGFIWIFDGLSQCSCKCGARLRNVIFGCLWEVTSNLLLLSIDFILTIREIGFIQTNCYTLSLINLLMISIQIL
jgi:hypothetical protein